MPALLTSTSRPPRRSTAAATAAVTEPSSVPSATSGRRSSPSAAAGSRSSTATRAPRAASSRAAARPMPEPPPVTAATSPWKSPAMATLGLAEALPLAAEAVDLQLDQVAGAQVGVVGAAERDARRGAGVDHVARLQDHELAGVPDQVAHAEDHVLGGAVLAQLAVDPGPQAESLRVADLVGGDQPRAERVEGLP